MENRVEVRQSFKVLLLASALTVVLWFIPFAELITYPIRLFVTFIHETGHAIAALATLGGVSRVDLSLDGSGQMQFSGGWRFVVWTAGYLSTTLYGSALLLSLRRVKNARAAALVTGGVLLAITALFAGNLLAWSVGLIAGTAMLALGVYGKPRINHFLLSFLGVQCLLNAVYDLRTLLFASAYDDSLPTDAVFMAQATGIPALVWAFGWILLSAVVLASTLFIYYRSLRQRAIAEPAPPLLLPDLPTRAFDRQL